MKDKVEQLIQQGCGKYFMTSKMMLSLLGLTVMNTVLILTMLFMPVRADRFTGTMGVELEDRISARLDVLEDRIAALEQE